MRSIFAVLLLVSIWAICGFDVVDQSCRQRRLEREIHQLDEAIVCARLAVAEEKRAFQDTVQRIFDREPVDVAGERAGSTVLASVTGNRGR